MILEQIINELPLIINAIIKETLGLHWFQLTLLCVLMQKIVPTL